MGLPSRKLYRSRTDRMIGGVCGGLAKYYNIDPIVTRLIFAVLTIFNGAGVLLYIVLMIVTKEEPKTEQLADTGEKTKEFINGVEDRAQEVISSIKVNTPQVDNKRNILAIIIILIGIVLLMNQFFPDRIVSWKYVWPGILIVLGIYIVTRRK